MKSIKKETRLFKLDGTVFKMALGTSLHTYFTDKEGNVMMFMTDDGSLVNNNHFASFWFFDSLEEEPYEYISRNAKSNFILCLHKYYEVINEQVTLASSINKNKEEIFTIYVNQEQNIIFAVSEINFFRFRLKGKFEDIAREHRDKILTYTLATYTKDDEVTLSDIFMQGDHIEIIK